MSNKIKGVILAGGHGSRLRPFTKRLNKGMAPIYTPDGAIPQLLFPLNTLIKSGIEDIMIITSRDHCGHIVELLGDGTEYNCNLTYRIQEMDRPITGIAQALGLAKTFCSEGSGVFSVILGDNFYENTFINEFNDFYKFVKPESFSYTDLTVNYCYTQIKDTKAAASIFLKEVHDPKRFGVATLDQNKNVTKIVEKPENPETNYAVTGLYLYTSHVFDIINELKPSRRNELEITDVNNYYVNTGMMKSYILSDYWKDMGVPESAKAIQDYLWNKNAKLQK